MFRLTKMQRFCVWVTMRLPRIVITDSLPIVFALAFMSLGIGTFITLREPSVAASALPLWVRLEWALTFIIGGAFNIIGIANGSRMFERAGMALISVGSLTYSFALFASARPASVVIGVVFVLFSIAYTIRIIASTAARVRRFQG